MHKICSAFADCYEAAVPELAAGTPPAVGSPCGTLAPLAAGAASSRAQLSLGKVEAVCPSATREKGHRVTES